MQWGQVTLVGVGLLGGSLALAMRQRNIASTIVGYVRRAQSVTACQHLAAFDRVELDLIRAVSGAELIVLCTPVGQMLPLVEQMAPALGQGVLVTDVGSVKAKVVAQLEPAVTKSGARFLGSHPMAGRERTGVGAAQPDLFKGAACAITPTPTSTQTDVERLTTFWSGVGARPLVLSPELHDQLVARCSHLPHLLAAVLVNLVLQAGHSPEQAKLCGPGFRDTTRVASGSPEMWRDICQANQTQIVGQMDELLAALKQLRAVLVSGQWPEVELFLHQARTRRDDWLKHSGLGPGNGDGPESG